MDAITKNSYEYFPIHANFGIDLVSGESLTGFSISCIDSSTGLSSVSSLIVGSSLLSPEVLMGLQGGVDQDHHIITVLGTTNLGNEYRRWIHVFIYDGPQDSFEKGSSEEFTVLVNFSNELESADTIASRTVTASSGSDGSDVTATIIVGSQISTPKVYVGVSGGTDQKYYIIVIRVVTAAGYKYSRVITMAVRDV
jgi:hypothetical protein